MTVCKRIIFKIFLLVADAFLINLAFLLSFAIRYGFDIPELNFQPYKDNFPFITFIYMSSLVFMQVFKKRFCSYWEVFQKIFNGLLVGTLLAIALVYVFRIKWSDFPTSIFAIAFPIALLMIFSVTALTLRFAGIVKRKVVFIGKESHDVFLNHSKYVEKIQVENVEDLIRLKDIDEIIICKRIHDDKNFNLLIYLLQKLRTEIFFVPDIYGEILSKSLNDKNSTVHFLATCLGKKTETEESLIKIMDTVVCLVMLIVISPLLFLIAILVRLSSPGPVFYKQKRVGKDGKVFTLYKFRTMVEDAEKTSGMMPAIEDDPRVTKVGKLLRSLRFDEFPQLINILKGEMSLVGPRPENLPRVDAHKALQGLRLAIKPGLTGLAQVQSYYDLHPRHKIRYDYLYIQRRSLQLNLYILLKTVPVVLFKKGT
ncbi:sugar transferase [Planctomycetota bacterium]